MMLPVHITAVANLDDGHYPCCVVDFIDDPIVPARIRHALSVPFNFLQPAGLGLSARVFNFSSIISKEGEEMASSSPLALRVMATL